MASMQSGAKSPGRLAGMRFVCVTVVGAMLSFGALAGETGFAHDGSHYRFGNEAVTASF